VRKEENILALSIAFVHLSRKIKLSDDNCLFKWDQTSPKRKLVVKVTLLHPPTHKHTHINIYIYIYIYIYTYRLIF
jgi:hypothetical protein